MNLREKTYNILEMHEGGRFGFVVNTFLVVLIICSIAAVILESDPTLGNRYYATFQAFEQFAFSVFSIDYLLRVWVAPEQNEDSKVSNIKQRLRYMITPMAIIDLLAILPFFLGFFITDDLLILRSLRLFRAFKLSRYARPMDILLSVMKYEATTFFSAFFILSITIIIAATGIHLVEGTEQPDAFGSIPKSLWWATVTLTTIGYGDVVPITLGGKLLGGVIAVSGITMAALPAGIMASGFTAEIERRREIFQLEAYKLIKGEKTTRDDYIELEQYRYKLGLGHRDARLIMKEVEQSSRFKPLIQCPHCHTSFILKK